MTSFVQGCTSLLLSDIDTCSELFFNLYFYLGTSSKSGDPHHAWEVPFTLYIAEELKGRLTDLTLSADFIVFVWRLSDKYCFAWPFRCMCPFNSSSELRCGSGMYGNIFREYPMKAKVALLLECHSKASSWLHLVELFSTLSNLSAE